MKNGEILNYLKNVLDNIPENWLTDTTHRLNLYDEKLAKIQFLEHFEALINDSNYEHSALENLPTAFDYVRLGHPLSCLLEWSIGRRYNLKAENIISFSSKTIPVMAILRENLLNNKNTQINYIGEVPEFLEKEILEKVYRYTFELNKINSIDEIPTFKGSSVFISNQTKISDINLINRVDFYVSWCAELGSILLVNGEANESYISNIQHVRRRETIAMTPANCLAALNSLIYDTSLSTIKVHNSIFIKQVNDSILDITNTKIQPQVGSSGLSVQYGIMMGLIHYAIEKHKEKDIKLIVPTNCYGGTNDQARRVANCIENVEVIDLDVDNGIDMAENIEVILNEIANEDSIAFIIAEIPTNPRVEVPNLTKLREVLTKKRKTRNNFTAVEPVFILDQTFCPNIPFLEEDSLFSNVMAISYVSGSKFPSGGLCTSGYCVSNKKAKMLMAKIRTHLKICDNNATEYQLEILAKQLPSMNKRIYDAYKNTHRFVEFINSVLPDAKINFVSEELANEGFTPSVFSLDLPSVGNSIKEKETYKRELNLKLINLMIEKVSEESKFCVSYGQLKGCYWTIPATSTQGTTKEENKDYIVRVALSPEMDVKRHEEIFVEFI
ncbi:cystathionine beta-synthase, partial [Flavobacteriaceae bacterium]|nr:cystathionine beta-synthase [Flavobacteriaceae bacterium]